MGALGEGRRGRALRPRGNARRRGDLRGAVPVHEGTVLTWGDYGKITIPQVLGVNHWSVITVFAAGTLALFRWFEKKGSERWGEG
jgi:hypothetical protein